MPLLLFLLRPSPDVNFVFFVTLTSLTFHQSASYDGIEIELILVFVEEVESGVQSVQDFLQRFFQLDMILVTLSLDTTVVNVENQK